MPVVMVLVYHLKMLPFNFEGNRMKTARLRDVYDGVFGGGCRIRD